MVKNNPNKLIAELEIYKKNHSKEFYYETRALDRSEGFKTLSTLERATRFIYLNKTCFNGLYRVNLKGYFNTPIGSYENPNIADKEVILDASKALKNAIISNQTFDKTPRNSKEGDFVYFDPPYYPLTKTAAFTAYNENIFLDDKQTELSAIYRTLDGLECKVAQSNSNTEFINSLYRKYEMHITVMANRNINSNSNKRQRVEELIIRSYQK